MRGGFQSYHVLLPLWKHARVTLLNDFLYVIGSLSDSRRYMPRLQRAKGMALCSVFYDLGECRYHTKVKYHINLRLQIHLRLEKNFNFVKKPSSIG